jgi:diguanylate cyclase (GGDEF)-like protein
MKKQDNDTVNTFCDHLTLESFLAIQPHGVLLILNRDFKIIQYSENISDVLETSIESLMAHSIFNFLISLDETVDVKAVLTHKNDFYKKMTWRAESGYIPIFIHLHQHPKEILVEIERNPENQTVLNESFDLAQSMIFSMKNASSTENLKDLAEITCKNLLRNTEYDRVLIYKFDPLDCSGMVIGEALKEGMESYLNLHFPANDIPLSVREMYLKMPLRYIPTIIPAPVSIRAVNPMSQNSPDLSLLNLRMVAPVHIQYMKNMGLISSSSVAIVFEKKLWGIIACHNKEAKYLSLNLRMLLLLSASAFSMQMSALEFKENLQEEANRVYTQNILTLKFNKARSVTEALNNYYKKMMEITNATGMSFFFQGKLFNYGHTPTNKQLMKLIRWLQINKKTDVYKTSNLSEDYDESAEYKGTACGLLAIKITSMDNHCLLFYKPELVKTIAWAGNPNELINSNQTEYSPRNSFKRFLQKITGQSAPWLNHQIKAAEFIHSLVVNKQLQVLLQEQASHDPLTHLFNRSSLDTNLTKEINRASRQKQSLAILLVDIDFFKKINDTLGHLAGDQVLITFSELLLDNFREYDYIYRYGGEEFLIILPGVDCNQATKKAELLRKRAKKLDIVFNNSLLPPISISVGISLFPEHGTNVLPLIAAADAALYQAKNNGRDQTVIYVR